ncbi:MAG: 2'-deoxycytidine 5'-triphosphate deaminase, partial [Alphaproteobacteria bacterium]|nr:2'-deoxycytidine 5'-triphosphate deaminase [Alphaproteobacteria bacterium]
MKPTGILPSQLLWEAAKTGVISACRPIEKGQIQPASVDLRLGRRAWRVRASFLPAPGGAVMERIDR